MKPAIELPNAVVYLGSNLDVLPTLPDNSVDSIVTDPPYELGFMGKSWDSSGIAYSVELWSECMRVLKPGGHLLAFGGSRTWHRLAVAIEDAGFQMRDSIAWLYGSGFPKSLDISKAIDKRGGQSVAWFGKWLREWREENNISQKEVAALFPSKTGNLTGCVANWELGLNLPTAEQFSLICSHFQLPFESIEEAEREVIGQKTSGIANKEEKERHTIGASQSVVVDITAPATPEAEKWAGWGTALKPAFEPVVVARKPLVGTVAENVLAYGTGGLNIDASRIASDDGFEKAWDKPVKTNISSGSQAFSPNTGTAHLVDLSLNKPVGGRWPANIILDEYTAGLLGEQADASRFFYVSKANKKDRNEGLDNTQNIHPTVKPTDLMRYLVKLVTPPGGTVLDPFAGSGSTGKAALLDDFKFIGIELTADYLPIIEGRLRFAEQSKRDAEQAIQEQESERLF